MQKQTQINHRNLRNSGLVIEKVHPATSLGIVPENEDGLKLPELNVDTDL